MPTGATGDRASRLFIALWPDAVATRDIVDWQRSWCWPAGARVTADDRLHLTLHFIGDVAVGRLDDVSAGLAVAFDPFELAFGVPGRWRGGLALAVPESVPPALLALHARLADALRRLALPVEARAFRPHITLARRADGAEPPPRPLACRWRVDRYALVRSAGGYRTLREYAAIG